MLNLFLFWSSWRCGVCNVCAASFILFGAQVFVGLHLLVTRQEGVLYLKDTGVLVQEIASVRVS